MKALVHAISAIERSPSLAVMADAVRAFAGPSGYDRFVLYSATASRDEVIDHLYWVEGDWFGEGAELDARTYLQRCPVSHHVLETDRPFFWTKHEAQGEETYRIVDHPHGLGLHGLQVPIFGRHGLTGAMSFGGRSIDSSTGVRLALTLIAQTALRQVTALAQPTLEVRAPRLTPRERQVMRWIAAGKRQSDAALILGLSDRTIENHLRRVRIRLGATTTAEALHMVVRSGELAP